MGGVNFFFFTVTAVLLKNTKKFRAHKCLNFLSWLVKALNEVTDNFTSRPYTQLDDNKCKRCDKFQWEKKYSDR